MRNNTLDCKPKVLLTFNSLLLTKSEWFSLSRGNHEIKNLKNTLKKTPSPGKFQRSGKITLKSVEFVEDSDSIVTLIQTIIFKYQLCNVYSVILRLLPLPVWQHGQ